MESALDTAFIKAGQTPIVQNEKVALRGSKGNPLVLAGCLFAWLAIGGFLSWLIGDFGQALGEPHSMGVSLLIFSMFILSAFVILLVRFSSFHTRDSVRV